MIERDEYPMIITNGTIIYGNNKEEFLVEDLINSGGFGIVYRAKRLLDNSIWAVKTIQSGFGTEEEYNAFINEINTATKISCDNVIRYEFTHDGKLYSELPPYIIMEYADQGDLRNVINDQASKKEFLSNETLFSFYKELINGMKAVNSVLVHRDIKPENILLSKYHLKISDFGLSKFASAKTRTITFKGYGTYMYTAPEAWNNDKNTIQLDIYSMGIVFYELATLQYPYNVSNKRNLDEWKNAHMYGIPTTPDKINSNISPAISSVIMKMLEKSTSNRFSNWDDILHYFELDTSKSPEVGADYINAMLNNRLQQDDSAKRKASEEELQRKKETEFCNLIKYEFYQDIYKPLSQLIEGFNMRYPNGKIQITPFEVTSYSQEPSISIKTPSNKRIIINLVPIIERSYLGKEHYFTDRYGNRRRITPKMPSIREGNIIAWGGLNTEDKTGFNILLIESNTDIYGDFVLTENESSPLTYERRISPFAFTIEELPQEIEYIYSMHIYNSKIIKFSIEKFFDYILKYI